jgi:hypothetical protein
MTIDATAVVPHAPLALSLTITNGSRDRVSGDFSLWEPQIFLRRVGEPFELRYPPPPEPSGPVDLTICLARLFTTLPPGAAWTRTVVVAYDSARETFLLNEPGEYEFKASYFEKRSRTVLESNIVSVKVESPGGSEHEAYDAFTPELAAIAQGVSAAPLAELREAQQFLGRFGKTPYAANLRSGLETVLRGRQSEEERQMYGQVMAESARRPRIPAGGKEREAYDAFTPDMALIVRVLTHHDASACSLPAAALLRAGRFVARFGGTIYASHLRMGLQDILTLKGLSKTRTVEETALFDKLKSERQL